LVVRRGIAAFFRGLGEFVSCPQNQLFYPFLAIFETKGDKPEKRIHRTYDRTCMKFYLKESESESKLIMGKMYDSQFSDGRFVYSTGERIEASNWIQPKKGTGKPKKGHEDLTERLLEITRQATSYIRLHRATLTKEGLKLHLDSQRPKEIVVPKAVEAKPLTIAELWAAYLESVKGTVEPRTYLSYRGSFEITEKGRKQNKGQNREANFKQFLKTKKWLDITPAQFTITHYNLYLSYLKANAKPNTVAKRLKHFKQVMEHIQEDLKIPVGFDLKKIKYKETAGLKLSLTEDELKGYIEADLPDNLIKVRDLAVIQCSTGLRISDRGRIDKNLRGNKIAIEAKKTRGAIEIPIGPAVRAILEKYDYELPHISEPTYRAGIKAIHKKLFPEQVVQIREGSEFKTVPVWEEISSHDMVRTFVTLSAERGMSIPSIAKITGKSIATLLKNYLVESQKVAEKEMEKAWGSSHLKVSR
jgi:hypothetical protein